MPDVVAVEHIRMHAAMEQVALERLRESRFAGARKPGEPNDRPAMITPQRARTRRNFSLGPKNILALCDLPVGINAAENRAAAADFSIVHNNEPAKIRDAIMVVHYQWPAGLND